MFYRHPLDKLSFPFVASRPFQWFQSRSIEHTLWCMAYQSSSVVTSSMNKRKVPFADSTNSAPFKPTQNTLYSKEISPGVYQHQFSSSSQPQQPGSLVKVKVLKHKW